MSIWIQLAERGFTTDGMIRYGIYKLLQDRLDQIKLESKTQSEWIAELESSSLAVDTHAANEQHYEIPTAYFQTVLGKHLKYSSGLWPIGSESLDE